jgi:hypothetical protein
MLRWKRRPVNANNSYIGIEMVLPYARIIIIAADTIMGLSREKTQ